MLHLLSSLTLLATCRFLEVGLIAFGNEGQHLAGWMISKV